MDSTQPEAAGFDVAAADARAALRAIDQVRATAGWRPSPWAMMVVAAFFGIGLIMSIREYLWWMLGFFVLAGVLVVLLRKHLFHPYVRDRPRQDLDREERAGKGRGLLVVSGPIWIFIVGIWPPEPRWLALLPGIVAAVHFYCIVKAMGDVYES